MNIGMVEVGKEEYERRRDRKRREKERKRMIGKEEYK